MSSLLYRTNISIVAGCEELGLEDLEQCTHCNIWYHGYELIPDLDDNNICKFCSTYYGM